MSDYHFTGRPAVFACRAAKPECRTTIFTSRPDRLLFHDFTISFPLGSRQEVFACRASKPECRTSIFTSRSDRFIISLFYFFISIGLQAGGFLHLGPQNLNLGLLPQVFFCISYSLFCMSAHVFACRPTVSLPCGGTFKGRAVSDGVSARMPCCRWQVSVVEAAMALAEPLRSWEGSSP